jgi:hypothetical protein
MLRVFSNLVNGLANENLLDTSLIAWSSPVPFFGDLGRSEVATVGINPSNREFVDGAGLELIGRHRRFETLTSLRLDKWSDADDGDLEKVAQSCTEYFNRNPYNEWFRRLDIIASVTGCSYYSAIAPACHLDLVPYATAIKWGELSSQQQAKLMAASQEVLGSLIKHSPIRLLILNGRSVVSRFESQFEAKFEESPMPSWNLVRQSAKTVEGRSFSVLVDTIQGVSLGRRIQVVGFNHNIQSSYGVSRSITTNIRSWLGKLVKDEAQ